MHKKIDSPASGDPRGGDGSSTLWSRDRSTSFDDRTRVVVLVP
jgi:hypothetical protein